MSSEPCVSLVSPADTLFAQFPDSLLSSGSPCVIVDRSNVVCKANTAFERRLPAAAGRRIDDLFRIDGSHDIAVREEPVASPVEALYYGPDGALIPAWLHTVCEWPDTGERLLLVADGAPLRHAEMERLQDAPLAVLRVCADGVVRFANDATYSALSLVPERVIGRTLVSLFGHARDDVLRRPESDDPCLKRCFQECLVTLKPVKLEISVAQYTGGEREAAPLLLIPDLSPGGHVLGVVAVIELTLVDRVREQIARIARDASFATWQLQLECILEQVRRLIPFDHANFGMYADDVRFFRAFMLYPRDRLKWTERWLPLPAGIKAWIDQGLGAVPDVHQFIDNFPELRKSQVVAMYEDRGMRSSATLIAKDKSGPTSALTLCSQQAQAFAERDVELLRNLDLEPVLIRIEEQIQSQRAALGDKLRKQLAEATSLATVAGDIVDQLALGFHWNYVSLYRLDRQKKEFQLVHESPCPETFRIDPPDYVQSFEVGMLGASLKAEQTLIVNQVGEPGVEQYGYLALGREGIGSAMTIPLRLNHRIRWMLHIETSEAHAFHGPDTAAIEALVNTLQDGLRQRAVEEINHAVLRETRQGVVVVGMEGAILWMNTAARRLLAVKGEKPCHDFLSDYASSDDPCGVEVLNGFGSTIRRRVVLLGEDNRTRPVLVTRQVLDGSFDTAIWFLIDLRGRAWEVDMRFLRETVADVAQQTRAPLALASNLVRQLPKLCASGKAAGKSEQERLSERLLAEIGKVDITFERLAQGVEIRRYPKRTETPVDLARCITRVVESLPLRDQKEIQRQPNPPAGQVSADPERLEFVIRSLLAHLLRVRADDGSVAVALAYEDGTARLDLTLTDSAPARTSGKTNSRGHRDMLWRALRQAREDASLGLEALTRVIEEHGGTLRIDEGADTSGAATPPWTGFHITLPALRGEPS
jgi:PAS domain-containing protein